MPAPARLLLLLAVALGSTQPALASESAVVVALDHVDALFPTGGLDAPEVVELRVRRAHAWGAGTHVRLAQSFRGLPILDREVIVSLDLDERVVATRGEPVQIPFLPAGTVSEGAAMEAAVGFVANFGEGELWAPRARQAVWLDGRDRAHLVWVVDASTAAPINTWRILVDAHEGAVVEFRPTLHTVVGAVFPQNPRTSDLTEVELGDIDELVSAYARVVSCDRYETGGFGSGTCTEVSAHATPDDNGDFLFESDPTSGFDPLAEVQMYYHLDLLSRWFEDTLGFRHEGIGGLGISIEGVVNFEYNNAFYGDVDGDNVAEVAFGQTASFDYAYDGDVIIHEFGHSVFGEVVSSTGFFDSDEYGLEWASGGLNEGTADVFAMVRHPDPIVGEYVRAGGIRDLEEDRACPTALYGESHRDGETWGAYFWNVIDDERTEPNDAAYVLYGALGTWPSDVNWQIAGDSVVDAAERLRDAGVISADSASAFIEHAEASGIVGCGRVVPLDDGQEPTQLLFHSRLAGEDGGIPLGQQFSIEVPELGDLLRFRVKGFFGGPPELAYTVYMRRGEYVHHEIIEIPTQFGTIEMPVPQDFDHSFDGDDSDFEIELRMDSDPPLEPGATYYFSIGSRATGDIAGFFVNAEITVDADIRVTDAPAGDDDDGGDDDGGDSCQDCEASVVSAPPSWAVLLLLVPALRRRR
jgi:hypothetical protein